MDALSDVLRVVRLTGAVFFDVSAAEPWVAAAPPGESIVGQIFPDAGHLVSYHVITRGSCWAETTGAPPERLTAGDVVVFPHGDAHTLSSAPGMTGPVDTSDYDRPVGSGLPVRLSLGGTVEPSTHVMCGFLGCDARPFNPLLSALPRMMRVAGEPGGAISAFAQAALAEARNPEPGGEAVLGRLSELMFVDVIRRYLATLPSDRTGWLAGLRDPVVGRALAVLHRDPARAWTLDDLSRAVAMSRSVLADRFSTLVGMPPMQYLANWRMQLAASHLLAGTDTIATVAGLVGYESEAAFSRSFKKIVGTAPAAWRRERGGQRRVSGGPRA